MRLIDADELKEKLLKIRDDIVSKKSDVWKATYLLVFDKYIKMLDEMPNAALHCDCNSILDAYGKGYLKGREDILSEIQLMKDYCKNDCDTTYEAYNKWMRSKEEQQMKDLYKHDYNAIDKMRKAKNEAWGKIIQDIKLLGKEAHEEKSGPLHVLASVLDMKASRLYKDDIYGTIKQKDKSHMWSLVDEFGCYSIKGETIRYLPEYQELTALMRKVF